jgi:hypothetical protein
MILRGSRRSVDVRQFSPLLALQVAVPDAFRTRVVTGSEDPEVREVIGIAHQLPVQRAGPLLLTVVPELSDESDQAASESIDLGIVEVQ